MGEKVVNITRCILLKQHLKVIILIILVSRCKLTQKRSTEIDIIQGISNIRNCGTAAHYIITIKHINIMYALFDSQGHILQGLIISI